MFEGEDKFINDLKSGPDATADQAVVIDELLKDPDFKKIWDYLRKCKVKIKLTVGRVVIDKVERFGGYDPTAKELTINPHKKEHQDNPQELVDTIVHELIHAVLDVRERCGERGYPFDPKVVDLPNNSKAGNTSTKKKDHVGDDKNYMDKNYGDSASAPATEYIDENIEAQRLIDKIVKKLIKKTGKGKPTITSKNVEKLTKPP